MSIYSFIYLFIHLFIHLFQHGGSWRHRSLIEDAKFETVTNIEFEKQERKSRGGSISEEDEVFTGQQNGEVISHVADKDGRRQCSIMITLKEGMTSLSRIIRTFEVASSVVLNDGIVYIK